MVVGLDAVRLAALGIGLVGLLVAAGQALRFRGERMLAPSSLLLAVVGLGVSAALAVLLPPIAFHTPVLMALLGGGAIAGIVAGAVVRVRRNPAGVVRRGGAWHLLPAAIAFLGLQVAGLAGSIDGVVLATVVIVACTAFAITAAGVVVVRGSVPGVRVAAPATASVSVAAPPLPAPPSPAQIRASCGACGAPVSPGWRHCVTCGAALAWR